VLKKLRLSGLLESLEVRLQEAAGHGLSHGEFLELILQDGSRSHPESGCSVDKIGPRTNGNHGTNRTEVVCRMNNA
jgi:hypothetical protein